MNARMLVGLLIAFHIPQATAFCQSGRPEVLRGIKSLLLDYGIFTTIGLRSLDSVAIRTKMELDLRRAGISVTAFSETVTSATLLSTPMLQYKITGVSTSAGVAFTTTLSMTEASTLHRLPFLAFVASWEARPLIVWSPGPDWDAEVMRTLQQQMDEFVNAYLTANPPR